MRGATIRITGNTSGLRSAPLRRLERIANRRLSADYIVDAHFARALAEISREIQRQVGVLVDRRGQVRVLVVGDAKSLFLPDLSTFRVGKDRLNGLRLVHTHLNSESIDDDDLTDLALLRLDAVAAIGVSEEGRPSGVQIAHMLPGDESERPWEVSPPVALLALKPDFIEMVDALEDEFARARKPRRAGDKRERAVLVHVSTEPRGMAEDSLSELQELCRSAGLEVLYTVIQRRSPDPRFVVGKGRLTQTVIKAMQLECEAMIFDMNLSPAQIQALAERTDLKVLDRTQVILDIFAQHAQTREGKIQVELAQLRYLLPRLGAKQSASALSRLTGGIGGRGPGETKLEIDRRRAQDRISQLEREIGKLGDRRRLRRARRSRKGLPVVSIIGYTNAGKSTLLNQLTQSEVLAEDALFATLNPVSRRLRFPREREIIITDTVGFIRNLPKELMAAFRTTLEELEEADLLLHVMDASSPYVEEHWDAVNGLLADLALDSKPVLRVLNKQDRCDADTLGGLVRRYQGVPVSALDRASFTSLLNALEERLWSGEGSCEESWTTETREAINHNEV